MSVDPNAMMERAKLTQEGMAQFERMHSPVLETRVTPETPPLIVCLECETDWPCTRMTSMLLVQGMAMLQSMIPSGNVSGILGRFANGGR